MFCFDGIGIAWNNGVCTIVDLRVKLKIKGLNMLHKPFFIFDIPFGRFYDNCIDMQKGEYCADNYFQ